MSFACLLLIIRKQRQNPQAVFFFFLLFSVCFLFICLFVYFICQFLLSFTGHNIKAHVFKTQPLMQLFLFLLILSICFLPTRAILCHPFPPPIWCLYFPHCFPLYFSSTFSLFPPVSTQIPNPVKLRVL